MLDEAAELVSQAESRADERELRLRAMLRTVSAFFGVHHSLCTGNESIRRSGRRQRSGSSDPVDLGALCVVVYQCVLCRQRSDQTDTEGEAQMHTMALS